MTRRKQLYGVFAGALLPVALTWATAGAINEGDPRWVEIRQNQLLITATIPDCDNNWLMIHGFYFEEAGFPIDVSLELQPLTVLDSDETFIWAELPVAFCSVPGSYLLTVTRERWTPSFGQVFVTAKVESGVMIQATLG